MNIKSNIGKQRQNKKAQTLKIAPYLSFDLPSKIFLSLMVCRRFIYQRWPMKNIRYFFSFLYIQGTEDYLPRLFTQLHRFFSFCRGDFRNIAGIAYIYSEGIEYCNFFER